MRLSCLTNRAAKPQDVRQLMIWTLSERFQEFSQYTPLASYGLKLEESLAALIDSQKSRVFIFQEHLSDGVSKDVGFFTFSGIDRFSGVAEGSIFSENSRLPLFQAMGCVLNVAFNELGLRKLNAEVIESHGSWISVLERLGFKSEGRAPRKIYRAGRHWDTVLMAIFRDDQLQSRSKK